MLDRPDELAQNLLAGVPTAVFWRQLDALLVWLGNPDNPRVAALDAAIVRRGLTRLEARGRAYDMLDRILFLHASAPPHRFLGLPDPPNSDSDRDAAKLRYRRLIQAYHPDRHPERAGVLTGRLEQIILAYARLGQQADDVAARSSRPAAAGPASAGRRRARKPPRRKGRRRRSARRMTALGAAIAERLRAALGRSATFEARFFTLLVVICALILASLLLQR